MSSTLSRREFLKTSVGASAALGAASLGLGTPAAAARAQTPLYKISLAQWSINQSLRNGKMQHLDFAKIAKSCGIDGIEYVNQFFPTYRQKQVRDEAHLKELNQRAKDEGVTQVLIMCDGEGDLGNPDAAARQTAVENHYRWIEAVKILGGHSIRVNAGSKGTPEEQSKLVADGMHTLCEYGDKYGINVIIENHGGLSSNAKWLMATLKLADHPRAGTLPDFGNFSLGGGGRRGGPRESYDSYVGVAEMMPLAKGVSVKPRVRDFKGNQSEIDLHRMMKIVVDAGYHGYCGIEYGPSGRELEGIIELRKQLETVREQLTAERAKKA
jgi:sugar phosphate isomerase/epimerase